MSRLKKVAGAHPFVVVPFLFYFFTCSRGIGMSDTAILIGDILDGRISAAINSHNLSVLFGRIFTSLPVGNLAFRANLMSVFFGGLAISLFYALVFRSFGSRVVAAMAAALLMISHSMWWHSTAVESYAINACLVIGALLLLERYRRAPTERVVLGLVGLAGISVFHHAQLAVIGLAALVVAGGHVSRLVNAGHARETLPGFLARAVTIAALSLVPYGFALASDVASAGGVRSAISEAGGGPFKEMMFRWANGVGIVDTVQLTLIQFPSPFLLLIPVGCMGFLQRWGRSTATAAVLTVFIVNTGFFAFFHTWDRFAFLLVSFIVLAFWGAFALDQLVIWARQDRSRRLAFTMGALFVISLATPPWMYARMASWNAASGSAWALRFGGSPSSNTINSARNVANPDKRRYDDIDTYFGLLFDKLPPNAVYLDDDSRYYTLEYYRLHEKRRPDLQTALVNAFGFSNWGLTKESFRHLVEYAYAADLPLFLPTVGPPFGTYLNDAARVYRFVVVPLDADRFIYRLLTSADEGTEIQPPFVPIPRGMRVVRGRDPLAPNSPSVVDRDEDLAVRFDFEENLRPFPVVFRWMAPDGRPRFSGPIDLVPAGSVAAAWIQERRGILVPGPWRVEAWVGTQPVDSVTVEVR